MRNIYILIFCAMSVGMQAQSVIQTINSGSIISPASMVSIGEIVIVPANSAQPSSGLIGILAQIDEQLEVPAFEVSGQIVAFPNPTAAGITFRTDLSLSNDGVTVYNNAGQLVMQGMLNAEKSFDLSKLPTGIYIVKLAGAKNKPFKIIKH